MASRSYPSGLSAATRMIVEFVRLRSPLGYWYHSGWGTTGGSSDWPSDSTEKGFLPETHPHDFWTGRTIIGA